MTTRTDKSNSDTNDALKQLAYLAAALKAPRITEAAARLADQEFDWDAQPAVRQQIAALASGSF